MQAIRNGKVGDFLVGERRAGAAQAAADDRDEIARRQPALLELAREIDEIAGAEILLELGERAERQTQPVRLAAEARLDLAAMLVGQGALRSR